MGSHSGAIKNPSLLRCDVVLPFTSRHGAFESMSLQSRALSSMTLRSLSYYFNSKLNVLHKHTFQYTTHHRLVLRPSCVPENVDVNKKGANQKLYFNVTYIHIYTGKFPSTYKLYFQLLHQDIFTLLHVSATYCSYHREAFNLNNSCHTAHPLTAVKKTNVCIFTISICNTLLTSL